MRNTHPEYREQTTTIIRGAYLELRAVVEAMRQEEEYVEQRSSIDRVYAKLAAVARILGIETPAFPRPKGIDIPIPTTIPDPRPAPSRSDPGKQVLADNADDKDPKAEVKEYSRKQRKKKR